MEDIGTEASIREMTEVMFLTPEQRLPKPFYEDEFCTLFCGDCQEILPSLGPVDCVISDPPYGELAAHDSHLSKIILRNGEPAGQALGFTGITQDECVKLAKLWTEKAKRWVVFTCEWKYARAIDEAGLLVRLGVWRKPDGAPQFTGDRPGTGWEAVAVCHRQGRKQWNGGGKHAFWNWPKGQNTSGHPTGKPIGLFCDFIRDFSNPGETILDPFAGSGTTGVAAKQLGRKAILIELEEKYCVIAAERLRNTTPSLFVAPSPKQVQESFFTGDK